MPDMRDLETLARDYYAEVSTEDWATSLPTLRIVLSQIAEAGYTRILDCGTGLSTVVIRSRGLASHSVDDSEEWLEKTRVFLERHDLPTDNLLLHADLEDLRGTWDYILHDFGLSDVYRWKSIAHLYDRCLAPGGTIWFDDMHHGTFSRHVHEFARERALRLVIRYDSLDRYGRFGAHVRKPPEDVAVVDAVRCRG
jgi:hypothetical protein